MPIKAIIWDMGGVLLQMNDEGPRQVLARQYDLPLEKIYWAIFDSPSAKFAGVGKLTIQEHWRRVAGFLDLPLSKLPEFQRQFWSSDYIDTPLIDFIRTLRRYYKSGLLSNAWDNLRAVITNEWGISDAFDELIVSAEVGLAKPDPRIYRLAIDQLGVSTHEAIFIDDMHRNVQVARTLGLQAIQFNNRTQTLLELKKILAANGQSLAREIEDGIDTVNPGCSSFTAHCPTVNSIAGRAGISTECTKPASFYSRLDRTGLLPYPSL